MQTQEINLLSAPVTPEQYAAIIRRFDCFTRADVDTEAFLDCTCFEEDSEQLEILAVIIGAEAAEEWATQYVFFYIAYPIVACAPGWGLAQSEEDGHDL